MARPPKSQIQENLMTKGNEFVFPSSGVPYRGEYHIIQGQAYAGANPSTYPTSIALGKSSDSIMVHVMGNVGFASAGYELAQQNIETAKGLYDEYKPQQIVQSSTRKSGIHNYLQKSNDVNKIIKEISSTDVYQYRLDPINKIVTIDFDKDDFQQQLTNAEKIIPGITTFVNL